MAEVVSGVKVGDRVRATCGENVIVGTVTYLDEGDLEVDTGDAFGTIGVGRPADWNIEVIAPPISEVVGTIVRDADGDTWQRASSGWLIISEDGDYGLDHVQKHYGPLTVLWTPGDPS